MNIMKKQILDYFKKIWTCEKYTSNKDAANIIKRFVHRVDKKYEWDDFESITETNPNVRLALYLCWYFANLYPINNFCEKHNPDNLSSRALDCYLKVADALENDRFNVLDQKAVIESLKKNTLPGSVRKLLDIDCHEDSAE